MYFLQLYNMAKNKNNYQNWRSCFHALVFDRHDVSPSADKWSLMIDAFSDNFDGFSLSSIIKSNLKEYEFYFTYLKIFMHWVRAWPWRMWNQEQSWSKKELHSEGVMVAIVGGFEFEIHKINCSCSAWDEENLHAGIVDADKVCHKIKVTGNEHNQEQNLETNTYCKYLIKQHTYKE